MDLTPDYSRVAMALSDGREILSLPSVQKIRKNRNSMVWWNEDKSYPNGGYGFIRFPSHNPTTHPEYSLGETAGAIPESLVKQLLLELKQLGVIFTSTDEPNSYNLGLTDYDIRFPNFTKEFREIANPPKVPKPKSKNRHNYAEIRFVAGELIAIAKQYDYELKIEKTEEGYMKLLIDVDPGNHVLGLLKNKASSFGYELSISGMGDELYLEKFN